MRFLDLFAGIGGFRLALERAGHKCIGYVEIDKFARRSYEAMYDTDGEWTRYDITEVTDEDWRELNGKVDIIVGGFPCQAFSVAGRGEGFRDPRGTLFFEIARATEQIQPRLLLLENVPRILSHDKGATFTTILSTLDELGYDVEWFCLNSKNHGVPQNRERVFIVGHLRGSCGREIFPLKGTSQEVDDLQNQRAIKRFVDGRNNGGRGVHDVYHIEGLAPTLDTMKGGSRTPKILMPITKMIDGERKVKYKLSDISPTILASQYKAGDQQPKVISIGNVNPSGGGHGGEVYFANGLAPTITTGKGEGPKVVIPILSPDKVNTRQNGRRLKTNDEPMFTLTAQDRHGVMIYQRGRGHNKGGLHDIAPTLTSNDWHQNNHLIDGLIIRKLTPRECWRLQGFPDELFDKAQAVNSDSQLYKQAGNAVTVNVVYEIAKRLKEGEVE